MFAMGAAMRARSDADVILMWRNAFAEDSVYALKCLFYLRDVRGGQGERRFFRLCMRDLAEQNGEAALRNLEYIPEFGRWDDLYIFVGTPLENKAFALIKKQLALDVQCNTPSLLAKWLKSENASSKETRRLAIRTRKYLNMTPKEYRKTLSILRARINVLETLMSANRWDEIEFDKIPSKAGLIYKNAFARRDIIKAKYETFAKDKTKKVNAKTLNPYEVVQEAVQYCRRCYGRPDNLEDTDRLMINKYWDNLTDYFNGATLNALCVVDTSGSMLSQQGLPLAVAISLGLYCAERAQGPFANHYISFASRPQLIKTEGVDFVDKVYRIYRTNLIDNTNLEATFDLMLNNAIANHCTQADLPEKIIIISDMQIDEARFGWSYRYGNDSAKTETDMEIIRKKWEAFGYTMPKLIYWNVNASKNTILDGSPDVTYVSGCSPVIFEQIMTGKTGVDLMYDKLDSDRYSCIK